MRLIIIICMLFTATTAKSASYDCSLAQTDVEKMICDNPDISQADESLAAVYKDIKEHPKFNHQLYSEQRAWLRERNSCQTEACIMDKYMTRIAELNDWLQKEKDKAKELASCTDRPECWPEGSAMHTGLTIVHELEELTSTMNSMHEQLLTLISNSSSYTSTRRIALALKTQQTSWEKYRGDECTLIGALTGAGGSWPSTYANECELELTQDRSQRIEKALECVKKIPEDMRAFELAGCITDLTPLVKREPISI